MRQLVATAQLASGRCGAGPSDSRRQGIRRRPGEAGAKHQGWLAKAIGGATASCARSSHHPNDPGPGLDHHERVLHNAVVHDGAAGVRRGQDSVLGGVSVRVKPRGAGLSRFDAGLAHGSGEDRARQCRCAAEAAELSHERRRAHDPRAAADIRRYRGMGRIAAAARTLPARRSPSSGRAARGTGRLEDPSPRRPESQPPRRTPCRS